MSETMKSDLVQIIFHNTVCQCIHTCACICLLTGGVRITIICDVYQCVWAYSVISPIRRVG